MKHASAWLLLLCAAGCAGPPPRNEPPAAPPPPALGTGFGDVRLGKMAAVPPQGPDLAAHPGRELLAEWLSSTAPSHRTWWLRGADGGPAAYPHALLVYGRGSADAPARTRPDAPSWLQRETWTVPRAFLGALATFLAREATAADPQAALAAHGIAARGLLLATPRALVYDSSREGELIFQLLTPAGDHYAVLSCGKDRHLNRALREYLLGGNVLVGKLPFPDALPAGGVPGHLARRPELLDAAQRATLDVAQAALARGPNPQALAQLGVDTTLAELRQVAFADVLGRRLGRITDPTPLPDHARVRRDVPAWTRRFAAAWEAEIDLFSGREDGDLAWLLLLRAGNPVSPPRIAYAHEAVLAIPRPGRYPTAAAALEPLGAALGPVQSIHAGFVLARTSRPDVFVVAFPQASTERGLDGAPAYGLLLLAPGSPVRGIYADAPGIPWAGLEGEALIQAAGRLPRRALITLLRAAPVLAPSLADAEPLLRATYERQTAALLALVERSPILAALAARERVTAQRGVARWDRSYAERVEQFIDLQGRPLPNPQEGLVEPTIKRQGEYARLTADGIRRLRAYAEDRAARGAPATAEVARQLSFGPDLRWRVEFLFRHAALPALNDPEFQALAGAMPPLVRTLPGGSVALRKAMQEAPPDQLRTGSFEVLPWELERCELITAWGAPAARVEVQKGGPDPALVQEYEAAVAGARQVRTVANASVLPVQVTHHYQWTDGTKMYGHLYTERQVDPVEHKRHFELQMAAIDAELGAKRALEAMLASQTRSVTIFTPRLHSRFAVELVRKVKLRSGERVLERELRHATVLAPMSELCPRFESPDPHAQPEAALKAVHTRRAGERAAVIEAARAEAEAGRALTTLKLELFRQLVAALHGDPRTEPRPEGLDDLEWAEERAWRAWWLGLPPAEDERVFLDFAKEIQQF